MTTNRDAFLTMLAISEGTQDQGDQHGYNVLVGSRPGRGIQMATLKRHPHVIVQFNSKQWSSAAGRYQLIWSTWCNLEQRLNLPDFSPASQDAAAIELIRGAGALNDVDMGRIEDAITKCRHIWASLPGAGYDQHENQMADLITAYQQAGGEVAAG